MNKDVLKIGVLVSGRGSNLQSIIDAIEAGRLKAQIRLVISDKPGALALERAERHSIPTRVMEAGKDMSRQDYDTGVASALKEAGVELVVLAGFMRILSPALIIAYPMRIMNIHPALLPSFPGLNVQKKALDYGVKFSGCTVHFVTEGVDTGPIIIQRVVPVDQDDTIESLSERILAEEHRLYPEAIRLFSEGLLEVRGRRVHIKAESAAESSPRG